VGRISTIALNDKHLVRPPTDHCMRLLEVACPNHAHPIRHKLKDSGMTRSLMTIGFHTWGAELEEWSDGSDMTQFPEENAIMTVYRGRPHRGGAAFLAAVGAMGAQGCNDTSFPPP
jgi:hypothetical protein